MCGITGICSLNGASSISPAELAAMTGALRHRGPDGSGMYIDDQVGLGHTRLSIIDLSGGAQPIHNENRTLWTVYNGEIFNYPELRQGLEQRGHSFSTSTDTEVIVHLYEEEGPGCIKSLNGQFALAIWDSRKKELFLARDRAGILPLHYTISRDRLLFASEIKSIFMAQGVERSMDPLAMEEIFTFWTTLPGRTFFRNIQELEPGHYLTVSAQGVVKVRRYWDIPFRPPEEQTVQPVEELSAELKRLIHDAVRIRLRADVPVGCYLSGGLDSSGITTLVKRNFNNRVRTFGIRFDESAFDEGEFQQCMTELLGTEHTAVQATNHAIGEHFRTVLWHCEKPLLRTAPVPLFLLSGIVARSGFKVVLTGEGADEIFGGYNIFREAKIRRFWARQIQSRRRPLLIARLYPYLFQGNTRAKHALQSFFGSGLDRTDDPLYSHAVRWQNTARLRMFFSEELQHDIGDYNCRDELKSRLPEDYGRWDSLAQAQYLETIVFLNTYLLSSQGDRVAMGRGVEVRPPYLDHRIIEFMGQVPAKWKIRGLNEKYLLKKTFQGIVPEKIINRPKHPYRAPIRESLFRIITAEHDGLLSEKSLRETGLFDAPKVAALFRKAVSAQQISEMDGMALAGIISSQIVADLFTRKFSSQSVQPVQPELVIDRRSGRTTSSQYQTRIPGKRINPE